MSSTSSSGCLTGFHTHSATLEVIAHPFNASRRNLEELPKLNDYFKETSDQYWKINDEIKDSLKRIEKRPTSPYKEMADAGMITASEFNALVAKKLGTGNLMTNSTHTTALLGRTEAVAQPSSTQGR